MFIGTSFITASICRQLRIHHGGMGKEGWYTHVRDHGSAIKQSTLLIKRKIWLNLKTIMLRESLPQKRTFCMVPVL
jgi:hypothetical protein